MNMKCQAFHEHEMPSLIFSEKCKRKANAICCSCNDDEFGFTEHQPMRVILGSTLRVSTVDDQWKLAWHHAMNFTFLN